MTPYYDDGRCVIYHGDWRDVAWQVFDVNRGAIVTDPPFGISYESGQERLEGNARSITNDSDTSERDDMLQQFRGMPALVFGSYRAPRPAGERMALIWDQDGALGMGDLRLPWKPSWQLIHVIGQPWAQGRDRGAVYRCPPVQSMGRFHPHQKPVSLLGALIDKCCPGTIYDPFMGSGSTLIAAKGRNRKAIGIEIEERYCEIAAKRLAQEVLDFGSAS